MNWAWWDDPRCGKKCWNCGDIPGGGDGCDQCFDLVIAILQYRLEEEKARSNELFHDLLEINPKYIWEKAEKKMKANLEQPTWDWRQLLKKKAPNDNS